MCPCVCFNKLSPLLYVHPSLPSCSSPLILSLSFVSPRPSCAGVRGGGVRKEVAGGEVGARMLHKKESLKRNVVFS